MDPDALRGGQAITAVCSAGPERSAGTPCGRGRGSLRHAEVMKSKHRLDERILVNWRNPGQSIYTRPFSSSALGLDIRLPSYSDKYLARLCSELRDQRTLGFQVDRAMPSLAAASDGPKILSWDSRKASSMSFP